MFGQYSPLNWIQTPKLHDMCHSITFRKNHIVKTKKILTNVNESVTCDDDGVPLLSLSLSLAFSFF